MGGLRGSWKGKVTKREGTGFDISDMFWEH